MSKTNYNWKRFWCPRGESFNLDFDGYLIDPDSETGKYYNYNAVSLNSLSDVPCLVLLGEPGTGKSHELNKFYGESYELITENGDDAFYINLNSIDSGVEIRRTLDSQIFELTNSIDKKLYLFIDSLDEGILNIKTLGAILKDILIKSKNMIHRINLRIACRTAEWQDYGFEDTLEQLWEKVDIKIYEIIPLRRIDIIEALTRSYIKPEDFIDKVKDSGVVAFAIKPITFLFLLDIFQKENKFPDNQSALYYEGCRKLCDESNLDRRMAGNIGNLECEQRLAIAERIAVLTIFSNKNSVFVGSNHSKSGNQDILIKEICGGKESAYGNDFAIGEREIREALSTSLFRSYGEGRLGWSHKTYAEFLAAHYLMKHEMPLVQKIGLIVQNINHEEKVIDQLRGTAA